MNKISLVCLLAAVPFYASASAQNVEEKMLCQGADETTIILELWKPSQCLDWSLQWFAVWCRSWSLQPSYPDLCGMVCAGFVRTHCKFYSFHNV